MQLEKRPSFCVIMLTTMLGVGAFSTATAHDGDRDRDRDEYKTDWGWFGGHRGHHDSRACDVSDWQLKRNVRTVIAYYTLSFNAGKPELAVEKYVGVDENGDKLYIQHNPFAASGTEAFIAFVNFYKTLNPDLNVDIVRTIAQCDLVMTHSHITTGPDDLGSAAMDIFRIDRTGRIVEHWDAVQPVEADSANDNTQF